MLVYLLSEANPHGFVAYFPDEVFQAPAENDGGNGAIVEAASEFTAALDEVLRAVVRSDKCPCTCSSSRAFFMIGRASSIHSACDK